VTLVTLVKAVAFVPYLAGVVAIWLVSSMERPPVPEPLVFWNSDKLLHMLAYALLAALALFGVRSLGSLGSLGSIGSLALSPPRISAVAFAMSALYGCIDELHQRFVPGRSSSWLDILADTMGAALVAVAWLLFERRRLRAQPS
jgi:VanZ family protein